MALPDHVCMKFEMLTLLSEALVEDDVEKIQQVQAEYPAIVGRSRCFSNHHERYDTFEPTLAYIGQKLKSSRPYVVTVGVHNVSIRAMGGEGAREEKRRIDRLTWMAEKVNARSVLAYFGVKLGLKQGDTVFWARSNEKWPEFVVGTIVGPAKKPERVRVRVNGKTFSILL